MTQRSPPSQVGKAGVRKEAVVDYVTIGTLWVVCAIGSYLVAAMKKDPSPLAWGLFGILLGPLGVLGAMILAKPAR